MIVKKNYSEDDYVMIELTNLWILDDNTYLSGVVLDCQDPTGEPCFKIGEEVVIGMCELVEVIEV